MGTGLAFKDGIICFHFELAFRKVNDSISICVVSEFGIILFAAEVNL